MATFDPARPDFTPYGFDCVLWRPSRMPRPDHHDEVELNLLRDGWVTYLLGGRKVRVEAGRMTVFWAAIPHQILDHGVQSDYFVATIPLTWFLQCRLPDCVVQPLLQGELLSDPTAGRAEFDQFLFAQWVKDLRSPTPEMKRAVMAEMEARLLRMAIARPRPQAMQPGPRRKRPSVDGGGANKVEQMACLIARRYLEKLTADEIGREVGLHPNYAMSLFRRTFGTTFVDYLTQHRVSHAQRLLATTEAKIVDIAFGSGFASLSRFNEAFRRVCGCSPRMYRCQHRVDR